VLGVVDALTADSITVDGVTYGITSFTEFKDVIAVGDQVKLHVIVNEDGTFTVSEIEKSTGIGDDNTNSSTDDSSLNSNDDGGSSINSNDDDKSNSNSNDDDHEDDNSNDSNSNNG